MHELYTKKYPQHNVKYHFYYSYFKDNFNIRFGRPQVDCCSMCEDLGTKLKNPILADSVKRSAAAELIVHKRRAKKFYASLKETEALCAERDDVLGLTFDFMQNLPLPAIPVQEIFYLRQLWVHAFEVHNMKSGHGTFYVYHEGEAKRGPNEVCTFLKHYVDNFVPPAVKELNLYSDSCPGQNRNHTMIRFLMSLVESGRFNVIRYFLPQRGHSFLPSDRDFSAAKRLIRRTDRIYVPRE